jgi:hypothetical protein
VGTSISPYDLYLGDIASLQGYRCRTLTRDSAPFVAPRFSSGDEGQTDLDLLKSVSVDDLSGGMFQRDWTDRQKVARAIGVYNPSDAKMYPTPPRSSATALSGGYYLMCKAESPMRSAFVIGAFSAGTYYNLLYTIAPGAGVTNIALPAAWATNGFCNVQGVMLHKNFLYICGQPPSGAYPNCYRYDFNAGTWQDIGGGLNRFCSIRNILYGINYNSDVFVAANETAAGAASYTQIDVCGDRTQYTYDFIEYNGAGWIAKTDGIFRFDGVKCTKVLNLVTKQLCVYNGALYFVAGMWLYRFDGTNVVKLQFFGSAEKVGDTYNGSMALASDSNFLYVSTVMLTSGYANSDKFSTTASGLKRIYTYDGAAFSLLHESDEVFGTSYMPGLVTNGAGINNKLFDIFANIVSGSWAANRYEFLFDNLYTTGMVTSASKLEVTTSEHDAGFPNIFKAAELVDLSYTGMIAGDSIVVGYQIYDGKAWGSWITLGTITSTTPNTLEIPSNLSKLYRRIKVSAVATLATGSSLALKGISLRYTLQPRMRWRWQTTIMAEGNSSIEDRNGNKITADANSFTNNVIKSIKQKTPIFMLSPDYGKVKTQFNNVALSFIIKGQVALYTDPYTEYPLVAVKNNAGVWEVLRASTIAYNSGTDETTITVLERGYYGVTAGTVNADAEFHLCYKVYVTKLLREAPVLDVNTYNEQDTSGESQIQREFLLELTEV